MVVGKSRNYEIARGVNRFSRSAMYAKRHTWKYSKSTPTKIEKKRAATTKEKIIGGDKNGGKRIVLVKRLPKYYPTDEKSRKLRSHGKKTVQCP